MNKKLKQYLKVLETIEDEATGEFFAVARCRDIHGGVRRVQLPMAELSDLKGAKKVLANAGAYLSDDDEECTTALRALKTQSASAEKRKFAPALGWYGDDFRRFVRPKGVVGKQLNGVKLCPPRQSSAHVSAIGTRGTHSGWKQKVAKPAASSSRMVLGICAAFAAPLLKVVDMSSFAIFLTGDSKTGKSTATLAAGSVIGFGTEEDLPNFRTTDAAFGELPMYFNDSLLPLNEFGLLKGNAKDRRHRQRDLAYGSAEARGVTYSRFVPVEKAGRNIKRHSIIFANGEETSDQIALQAGEMRLAGENTRWIDLPAAATGCPDVFDLSPTFDSSVERSKWYAKQCAAVRRGCKDHRGEAQRHFLKCVIGQRKSIKDELIDLRDKFTELVTKDESDRVVRHLAKNFGHIYAAGIQAVRFGTVPWSEQLVRKCVRRCYLAARREMKTEADLLRRGLRRLRARIKGGTINLKGDPVALRHVDGYRRNGIGGTTITVRADAFKHWFVDPRQPRLVLEWLRKQGCLPNRPPAPGAGHGIVWAESQPQWPDGTRPRCIVIGLRPSLFKILKR